MKMPEVTIKLDLLTATMLGKMLTEFGDDIVEMDDHDFGPDLICIMNYLEALSNAICEMDDTIINGVDIKAFKDILNKKG